METTMRGAVPGTSLSAGRTVICAVPEKKTLSGNPNTVPAMGTATVLGARALEGGAKDKKRIAGTSHRRVFMFASSFQNASVRTSSDGRKVTPCGDGIGVGSDRKDGAPRSSSSHGRRM